jgi:hypothetical protein
MFKKLDCRNFLNLMKNRKKHRVLGGKCAKRVVFKVWFL